MLYIAFVTGDIRIWNTSLDVIGCISKFHDDNDSHDKLCNSDMKKQICSYLGDLLSIPNISAHIIQQAICSLMYCN